MSAINEAVEAVIGMINALPVFAYCTRGALPTGNGITCEVGPSSVQSVFLDKGVYVPLDLTINGKHESLQVLSDHMNLIHRELTTARRYPSGTGWQIVDIATTILPRRIGRETDNRWLMASALSVRLYLGE